MLISSAETNKQTTNTQIPIQNIYENQCTTSTIVGVRWWQANNNAFRLAEGRVRIRLASARIRRNAKCVREICVCAIDFSHITNRNMWAG